VRDFTFDGRGAGTGELRETVTGAADLFDALLEAVDFEFFVFLAMEKLLNI
jgi:hypothetical protein